MADPEKTIPPFAARLVALRTRPRPGWPKGLTQVELGRRATMTQASISAIEQGGMPSDERFVVLADALGLTTEERDAWWLLRLAPSPSAVTG